MIVLSRRLRLSERDILGPVQQSFPRETSRRIRMKNVHVVVYSALLFWCLSIQAQQGYDGRRSGKVIERPVCSASAAVNTKLLNNGLFAECHEPLAVSLYPNSAHPNWFVAVTPVIRGHDDGVAVIEHFGGD